MRFTKIASVFWVVRGFGLPPVIANTSATANNNLGPAKLSVFVAKKAGKSTAKGRSKTKHRAARKSQGPAREESFEEVFPPGHKFTPDEKAEASTLGTYFANAMWKDAYKLSTKSVKQIPSPCGLHGARPRAPPN